MHACIACIGFILFAIEPLSSMPVRACFAVLLLSGGGLGAVPVTVDVDASSTGLANSTAFPPYWKRSFGSGHATLTLRNDWRRQLKQAIVDLGLQGIRHHGILDDDMRVVTSPRRYNFSLVEKIILDLDFS